jgi:putative protein-disulfide isomerase
MTTRHLIYFADPMCSWCYGFSPVIDEVRRAFGHELPVRVVMGGLRPGTETPMDEDRAAEVMGHWHKVAEATGLPFSDTAIPPGFVYDTDPAARAVVVAREAGDEAAADYLTRAQKAFYAEGRDVTSSQVLADLAAELGHDREGFLARWASEEVKNETWRDYAISQRAGVTGFPTLVAGPDDRGAFGVVTRGYAPAEPVLLSLRDWIDRIRV